MIRDAAVLAEVRADWAGMEALRSALDGDAMASFGLAMLGGHYPRKLQGAAHNLLFMQACSILNDVLVTLRDEKRFTCEQRTLGALVKYSKHALPWLDIAMMETIVAARNGVAHSALLLDRDSCLSYSGAICEQLSAWSIL